ncbi:UNVERIFIED_CONTAM: L-arabinokinase [Sesamum radiatum]|uniref:L-arabinokinase n=1 Tax=Sesamum radiatum TaxID=300843 RepID=A0AAW2L0Y5_SESRA
MGEEHQTKRPLIFAYYVTGHGFGHATRVVEVARHLILAGHDVHVVTGAPDYVFTTEIESPRLFLRKVLLDCGAVQADALTVDRLASLEKYSETAVVPRDTILATEVKWLKSIKADLVVSDVVPVACRAAADAGIRSVCVTNFSWDFIYAEYVMAAGHHHRSIVWQIAEDYSHCEFLIRLPGYCPMPAFRDAIDVPLVVRRLHKSRDEVRRELGIADDVKIVILNFGGQLNKYSCFMILGCISPNNITWSNLQPSGWTLKEDYLPHGWLCLFWSFRKFHELAKDAYTPDMIAASDCMLGKIGYGTVSEALAYKIPFVFVRRDYFNEEPFLRNMLEFYQGGVEMIRRDLLTGHWRPYLERAISLKPCYEGGINGGEVAARILQDTATGKNYTSDKLSGARRLRDAIVLGYQLQRVPGRDLSIPEWYANAENELGLRTGSATAEMNDDSFAMASYPEDFEILHGDVMGLSDTVNFLKSLLELDAVLDSGKSTEKRQIRERKAAANLFNWEEHIFVARAPGRLDVMGGIADYLEVLYSRCQPEKLAMLLCKRSIQLNRDCGNMPWPDRMLKGRDQLLFCKLYVVSFRLDSFMAEVSYGSELSNRGPTFDMDLSDFMDGKQPMSYEKARSYFARDPSQSISMLVSSAVPEGKGVSSSAAVEVATMSAIAAAHGLNINPRELALLCQKVENHVVGAPCGVMDQMTSACGEANKLLAMVCQPAEVLGLVDIPSHVRFWGIDSGIRHSVGGADYGSVRIGAFMGRKIIKSVASDLLSESCANGVTSDDLEEDGVELLEKEAALDYLCNLSPHRYEALYVKRLPETLLGETFLEKYDDHNDPVTVIDKKRNYGLRAATRHPIYENFRVKAFKALLTSATSDDQLTALGELMYQCHYSYSACGLGSDGTDRLVQLVQEMQHGKSSRSAEGTLYGAKITGGGSGGTVCVVGRNCLRSSEQILQIQQRYKNATGHLPIIFEGSSPGAGKFGHLRIRRRLQPEQN